MAQENLKSLRPALPRWVQFIFVVVIAGFLTAALVNGWEQIRAYEWKFDIPALCFAMILLLAYMVAHAVMWTWMVRRLQLNLPYSTGMRIYLWSQLAKYIPGGIWSFANVGVSAAQLGLSPSILTLIYIISTLLVLCVSVFFALPLVLLTATPEFSPLVGVAALIGIFLLMPLVLAWLIRAVIRWRKLDGAIQYAQLTHYTTLQLLLVMFSIIHLLAFGAFYCYFTSLMSVNVPQGLYAAMAWSGAWFVGLVVLVVPSGLGVREGALVWLLAPVIPTPVAIAIALGYRLFTTVLDLCILVALVVSAAIQSLIRKEQLFGQKPQSQSHNL